MHANHTEERAPFYIGIAGAFALAAGAAPMPAATAGTEQTYEGHAADSRPQTAPSMLRVCADPNNLPFSNHAGEGFENRIAELLARDFGLPLQYTWWPQRRGFVRHTLDARRCDVVIGVPCGYELTATTAPYYRSGFVFVTRKAAFAPPISEFDDARLRTLRIGVHVIGDDYSNPPPVVALSQRGIDSNVVGYSIYGDYARPNPPAQLIQAVERGEVDIAIAWGPLAGFYAKHSSVPLEITAAQPLRTPIVPLQFDVCLGVRKNDTALKRMLESALRRERPEVDRVLDEYGVPRMTASANVSK